jgi:hypothetical protein
MGVYFMWVNRTRREYIYPNDKRLNDNLKWPTGRSADVLFALMRFGRWSGDQIEILSDTGDEWDDALREWRNALDVTENARAFDDVF